MARSNAGGDDSVVHHSEVGHQTTVVGTAEALAVCPLDADVRAVIERHLQEHDFDEDLGLGTVEVREHLADILGGGLVRDIDHPVRLRVYGEVGISDGRVVGVCPRGAAGAAAGAAAIAAGTTSAEATTAEATTTAASCLSIGLNCQRHPKTEDAG